MPSIRSYVAALSLAGAVSCETLFASHYSGQIYTLDLEGSGSAYSLTVSSQITGCGGLPSWLTYDQSGKNLYCSDETFSGSGSVSSFSAGSNGALTSTGKATDLAGAVANGIYGGSNGASFVAQVH